MYSIDKASSLYIGIWKKVWLNKWSIVLIVSFLSICIIALNQWQRAIKAEEQYKQAVVIGQEKMTKANEISNELHISSMNAKELQTSYKEAETKLPVASFTVQAPNLEVAAENVADMIKKHDVVLPAAAVEKTDRTAVIKNDSAYKVDVLKINLDKSWEVSTGIGIHRGDTYIPVGVQRNYASNKAVVAELHLVLEEFAKAKIKTSGWEVKHVWRY